MDRSRPSRRLRHRWPPVRLGEPVNTATGPLDGQPPARERRVMGTSAAITVIAVGAILRFALAGGSPHGLNVHVVGVVLILAGFLGLLVSLLTRGGPRSRQARTRQAAAEDVAEVLGNERFYAPDAPGREEDDL